MTEIPEDIMPVGYVTKVELMQLRLGASCVDLFGQVAPKGFEMVPLYLDVALSHASLTAERDRLRDLVERAQAIISTATYPNWHAAARATLSPVEDGK